MAIAMNLGEKIGNNLKSTMGIVKDMETNIGMYKSIPVSDIIYNPKNRRKYSDSEIEELAESIKELGLQQNIVVLQVSENSYRLIAGERRTRAHKWLINQYEETFSTIYAKVYKNLDEVQEELILLQTNQLSTVDSVEERAVVAERINELIDTLIENGQKNGTRRDMMAQLSGKSGKQVERDLKLSKIIPELLKLANDTGLAQSGIIEFADMPKDRQLMVYNMLKSMTETGSKPNRDEMKDMAKQHKEELKQLNDNLDKIKAENQSLLKDKQTLENKQKGMQKEIDNISADKAKLKSELMRKDGEIQEINSSLEKEKKKTNPDKKELQRLQEELDVAKVDRETLTEDIVSINQDLKNKEKELQEAFDKANDVNNPLPSVIHNIELGEKILLLENTFADVLKKINSMKKENEPINGLNEDRLMKLSEKVISSLQK